MTNPVLNFDLEQSREVLQRTPAVLNAMLRDSTDFWNQTNEGENTWSAFDVVGHLAHGEKTDWMQRIKKILSDDEAEKTFVPFNRFAQIETSAGKTINILLDEFATLRKANLEELITLKISPEDLNKTGIHPTFGKVTLLQLLSTWVAHDLAHTAQICRVMAKKYKEDIGPWQAFMPIMTR